MSQLFKYEMHTHTSEVSGCSQIASGDMVRYYKKLGFAGVFITDHFIGNSIVPQDLPWKQQI